MHTSDAARARGEDVWRVHTGMLFVDALFDFTRACDELCAYVARTPK